MEKNIAENVAQSTSNIANRMLDKIDSATESGRTLADQGAKLTQKVLEKGIDKLNNVQATGCQQYDQCVSNLSRCLTQKPVQSALVIAGMGALLALWLSKPRRDNDDR